MSVLNHINDRLRADSPSQVPMLRSFREFLETEAKVKISGGAYAQYSFDGRQPLAFVAEIFDHVLGSHTGKPLPDSIIDVCGGAQFGKTILALNFGAYATAILGYNWGLYLPDDDLVEGIVDSKLRPDVIEQIDWLGPLMQVGKGESKTGRSVNRKGAFMVSGLHSHGSSAGNGEFKAFGMIRGMGKIPTSFSMDVAMEDEKDDIPAKRSKYLTGRMTASDLRLRSSIGTQRVHGSGQNKQFENGSQHVMQYPVSLSEQKVVRDNYADIFTRSIIGEDVVNHYKLGDLVSVEEQWPQVCRMQVGESPSESDPRLELTGKFKNSEGREWAYEPGQEFYLACPDTGVQIDREFPVPVAQRPDRIKMRKWSVRISQISIAAAPLNQIVSRWHDAVRDPDLMVVFRCDVQAMPQSTTQAITPDVIERSKAVAEPYDFSLSLAQHTSGYAGLDTGNRCWFVARESHSESKKRTKWAEDIPLGDMVSRSVTLFHKMQLSCLFIDARPAVDEARSITYALHGLNDYDWPQIDDPDKAYISFPGGLIWDGQRKRWKNLKAAVVEFTKKEGAGIEQKLGKETKGGKTWFYPIISCNRFETIDRAVKELLTPNENVVRVVDGAVLEDPVMQFPRKVPGSPVGVELLESHFITGSKKVEDDEGNGTDYVDKCENHLLLAAAYAALAEEVGAGSNRATKFHYSTPTGRTHRARQKRSGGLI